MYFLHKIIIAICLVRPSEAGAVPPTSGNPILPLEPPSKILATPLNPTIKFRANLMNDSGFMSDYSCKTRMICCHALGHAYRVNRFME